MGSCRSRGNALQFGIGKRISYLNTLVAGRSEMCRIPCALPLGKTIPLAYSLSRLQLKSIIGRTTQSIFWRSQREMEISNVLLYTTGDDEDWRKVTTDLNWTSGTTVRLCKNGRTLLGYSTPQHTVLKCGPIDRVKGCVVSEFTESRPPETGRGG